MNAHLCRVLAKPFPKKYVARLKGIILRAGEDAPADIILGKITLLSLLAFLITILIPFALHAAYTASHILIAIVAFLFIQTLGYFHLFFKAEDRTAKIEDALPDALQLVAANIKAGITPFKALKLAARTEFGPLAEEIHIATSKAYGTSSFTDALLGISKRVSSETLERALKLFISALESGGHLAPLLEELSRDIAQNRSLKKEMITNTKTYAVFIMFTIMFIAPLLLSVSIYFITLISSMQSQAGVADASFGMGFLAGEVVITPAFLTVISIILLFATSMLACMLLGVIKEGKASHGLRTAPIIIVGSLILFVIYRHLISNFFGNLT
ncbi:type II secretion system F family protein [Candidatus Woesearchaeota archaeon]|nr:MAG: archaeal flagellar protein FlaJ [archaeon GW2011_AR4]MBS3130333.1 type II secretion system F family protein [Candidatus Woesearchaeota archaeon]HIH38946.1 hypothetical protein [Candidatus Woesearchaeota archaeon]HIH48063.1 hypothetical protein [Candidatus Woesearchaeota archaeon]HIJ03407.1 hypothetical protein [Candidatus Woesearchaeota archaeon]